MTLPQGAGPVIAETLLSAGNQVQAEWQGTWWPAEVVRVNGDGTVLIHYTGWDASFDEVVQRGRLVLGQAPPAPAVENRQSPPGPIGFSGLERWLLGDPVTDETRLHIGDKVIVEWNGTWWAGEIVAVNDDGTVRIHYCGWESQWDETMPRTRLQTRARGGKLVTAHFDKAWSLKGTLLETLPDGYVISRAEDHKVCLIHKQNLGYLEIE